MVREEYPYFLSSSPKQYIRSSSSKLLLHSMYNTQRIPGIRGKRDENINEEVGTSCKMRHTYGVHTRRL